MGRAGPLAVDHFVKVVGSTDVCRVQHASFAAFTLVSCAGGASCAPARVNGLFLNDAW
mgnify:CR=1 FL=1